MRTYRLNYKRHEVYLPVLLRHKTVVYPGLSLNTPFFVKQKSKDSWSVEIQKPNPWDPFSFRKSLKQALKVLSAIFLLVCFVCLKKSTCETRKKVFYFTSKVLFVLEIIKF